LGMMCLKEPSTIDAVTNVAGQTFNPAGTEFAVVAEVGIS